MVSPGLDRSGVGSPAQAEQLAQKLRNTNGSQHEERGDVWIVFSGVLLLVCAWVYFSLTHCWWV